MRKYVVWGCGARGRMAVEILGTNRVLAIIDENLRLQNSNYNGIKIISAEEYFDKYMAYPVIVTPREYEKEIFVELQKKGVAWAFLFSECMMAVEGLLVQAPIERLIEKYNVNEKIAVYGFSLVGILLYEILEEKGFKVKLIIPDGTPNLLNQYIEEKLKIKIIYIRKAKSENMRLLLAATMEEKDCEVWGDTAYEKYYDLSLHKNLFYNPKIEKFKNMHKGQRCFIVATGPSLTIEDLNILRKNNEICISVNGIFKAFDKTLWRPDYYVLSDPGGMKLWKKDILDMDVKAKFISDIAWNFDKEEEKDNIYKWHYIRKYEEDKLPDFSDDFSRGAYFGHTITYEGGLQLAAYMGFSEIYLLGVDCSNGNMGTQHFVENYHENNELNTSRFLRLDRCILSYQSAKRYADAHEIKIYNVTRGGKLEVFERVDFDSLFEKNIVENSII